jgi:hypothetical protein
MFGATPSPAPDLPKSIAQTGQTFLTRRYFNMRRLSVLCAVAGLGFTALAAASPAQAAFHVIRWHDTGFCQVWDNSFSPTPWPAGYTTVTHRIHTFGHALAVKDVLLHRGTCKF